LAEPREAPDEGGTGRGKMVAEFQRECYHNSTVPVKEYLEVIEGEEDSFGTENPHPRKPRVEHPILSIISRVGLTLLECGTRPSGQYRFGNPGPLAL
jgi:hypothetical protein